jgi:hypothetical protein
MGKRSLRAITRAGSLNQYNYSFVKDYLCRPMEDAVIEAHLYSQKQWVSRKAQQ